MALNQLTPGVSYYGTVSDPNGLRVIGTPMLGRSANSNLRQLYEAQEREYQQIYRPINRELISSVDSTDLVAAARENAAKGFGEAGRARTARQLSRYGLDQANLFQQEADYSTNSAARLNYIDTVNNAFTDQYERNTRLRDELINVGRGIADSAQGNLSAASQAETAVRNQNSQIAAQNSAARTQMVGAAAAMAIMLM